MLKPTDKGAGTQRLLNEKENTIQLLKKKLRIPGTILIQDSELSELEKERENLNDKLTYFYTQLLKLVEKEKQWRRDMSLIVESEKSLKVK